MRSVFGPLLFAILPLIAVGCVLPERSGSRAEDLGFRPRGAGRPKVSTESAITPKTGSREKLASANQDPSRDSERDQTAETTRVASSDVASFSPGHSSDSGKSLENAGWPSTAPNRSAAKAEKIVAGKPSLGKKDAQLADGSSRADQKSNDNRPDDAVSESPIQNARDRSKLDRSGSLSGTSDNRPDVFNSKSNVASNTDSANPTSTRDRATDKNMVQPASAAGMTPKNGPIRQTNQTELASEHARSATQALTPAGEWSTDLDQLIARLEQEVAQSKSSTDEDAQNEYLRKHVHLRLLYMIAQRPEEAMTAIPGTDSIQQEYWQQMIWAMSNSLDTNRYPDAMERAAQTVPPLSAALRHMREQSALTIKNMTFCRKISYFGNYERFPRNDFTAGHEVLLYTEIENFVSSPTADGEYRTSLKSLIEIADAHGTIVWTKGFPSTEDFCRNPRRDYFHNYQFYIPEDLSTGTYTLKLTIIDELSKKRASSSLNFVLK